MQRRCAQTKNAVENNPIENKGAHCLAATALLIVALAVATLMQLHMLRAACALEPPAVQTAIYLNGTGGNDANDGTTREAAVRTFERAKELAASNQNITTIFVTGAVHTTGELSLQGTKALLKRDASLIKDYLLYIDEGETVTLRDIIVDGNCGEGSENVKAERALIQCKGTLNIENGTALQNNWNIGYYNGGLQGGFGGGIRAYSCTINITGGVIQNNKATYGGGIYATDEDGQFASQESVVTMTGGAIQNNEAWSFTDKSGNNTPFDCASAGGGVCIANGAVFNLAGGTIQGNFADEVGGGISVGRMQVSHNNNVLNMTGGTVDSNRSGATGGGIFIQGPYGGRTNKAHITGGAITNNRMEGTGKTNFSFGGGGVYVNGFKSKDFGNGELYLENVVVAENEAAQFGGGLAACPISNTKLYVKNGGALYANAAAEGARDIFVYCKLEGWGAHSGMPEYDIAASMLGGVPYRWKDEAGKEVPLNSLKGKLAIEGQALELHTDERGDAKTASKAKVVISGNYSATCGGGIGSNGSVQIGTSTPTTEIQVTKKWEQLDESSLVPDSVTVELWRTIKGSDEKPVKIGYEIIRPDADGAWELTFTNLPTEDGFANEYEYSVRETETAGFIAAVTGTASTGFTITNTPAVDIEVAKVWDDADDADGIRPASVTMHLLADEKDTGKVLELTAEQGWKGAFKGLPRKTADGARDIVYTVSEDAPEGYVAKVAGDAGAGFTITNTHVPTEPPTPPEPKEPAPRSPSTGDGTPFAFAIGLGLLAAGGLVLARRQGMGA